MLCVPASLHHLNHHHHDLSKTSCFRPMSRRPGLSSPLAAEGGVLVAGLRWVCARLGFLRVGREEGWMLGWGCGMRFDVGERGEEKVG